MRENMTQAEKVVWELLKEKKMVGLRFKAQHPIDIFIADFYCHALKLIIEIDGKIHKSKDQKENDIGREAELEHWGIKVIRFANEEVKKTLNMLRKKSNMNVKCGDQSSKVPFRGFRGGTCWQSWKAATHNPVEALRYE